MAAARMDWVMSPSSGDALLCFVKRAVPAGSQPEASVQTGTAKAVAVVVTGADLRLAVISDSHGRLIAPPNSSFPQ
ncbi:hypothetical protein AUS19_16185 [Escherichia coli]|nr:hypothetical protein AUS13_26790 [Escherichia coli]KXL68201.1 hypothetical protein AUS26_27970 [Escherichia coli]KXM09391.1 hypothetical protein AUS19_16185 [Escherichia coli]KXM34631.1 hypothetical protein AUS25_24225 [Escherichia coli]KXN12951.1 hypothetical protein AUS47_28105 [Escherichia coli]